MGYALLLTSIFILSVLSSGLVRFYLSTSHEVSLVVCSFVFIVLTILYWRPIGKYLLQIKLIEYLILILLNLIVIYCYNYLNLGGIASIGNADAGYHINFLHKFEKQTSSYNGFIALYSLVIWLKKFFSINYYQAYLVALNLGISILTFTLFFVAREIFLKHAFVIKNIIITTLLIFVFLMLYHLPLYQEFTLQGAFPHTFASIVYPVAALIYCLQKTAFKRFLVVCFWIIAVRHTYGLNLGDVFIISAILVYLDPPFKKISKAFIPFIFSILGFYSYYQLWHLLGNEGARTEYNLIYLWIAFFFAILLFFIFAQKKCINPDCNRIKRFYLFAACSLVCTVAAQLTFLLAGLEMYYYQLKYPLYISHIYLIALLGAFLILITKNEIKKLFLSLIAVTSLAIFSFAYYPFFYDTYIKKDHYLLAVDKHIDTIETVLAVENKKFGGYYDNIWPRYRFTNALFRKKSNFKLFRKGHVIYKPGYCVFWPSKLKKRLALTQLFNQINPEAAKKLRQIEQDRINALNQGKFNQVSTKHLGLYYHCLDVIAN